MNNDITKKVFYEKLLKGYEGSSDFIQELFHYLQKNDAVNSRLDDLYLNFCMESDKNNSNGRNDTMRAFISEIMDEAEDSRTEIHIDENLQSPIISFAPLNLHATEGFVGRKKTITTISSVLEKYGLVILCGIGGVGKSQTALHYAEQKKNENIYHQVQMVYFDTDLQTTIQKVPFRGVKKYQKEKDPSEEGYQNCLMALKSFHADSLLIIDNMDIMGAPLSQDDQDVLKELANMELHVLITSRNTALYKEAYMIPIKPLTEEEQLQLFRLNYSPRKDSPIELPTENIDKYQEICRMVSGHTMLIEIIAKTMREYSISPVKMIKMLKGKRNTDDLKIPVEKDDEYKQEDIYQSISTLFSINEMDNRDKQILMKLVLSSIDGIRMTFFDEFLLDDHSTSAIKLLVDQSWIIRESHQAAEDDRIHLHPLIQTAVLRNLHPTLKDCQEYLERTIKVYSLDDEEIKAVDRRDACVILIQAGDVFREEYNDDTVELLLRQANVIYRAHQYRHAWSQCELALAICKTSSSDTIQKLLPQAYCLRADLAVKLADYQTAIQDYHTAITMWEEQDHPPYEEIAKAYNHLANVYRKNSQYTEALDNFRFAENRMDAHAIDNPELSADIFNNIGIVYINLGNLDKALENYKKGMIIREKQKVQNKQQLAYSYHNIGTVYQRQHRCKEAIEWHERGLNLRREVYTPDDPIIADSLTMLGNDYAAMNTDDMEQNYAKALDYIQKGLKIRENSLGPNHPATAWSYESLGKVYYQQKKYEQAEESFRKCMEIRCSSLGEKHAYTAQIMVWMGITEEKLDHLPEAQAYWEKAYKIQEQLRLSASTHTKELMNGLKDRFVKNQNEN